MLIKYSTFLIHQKLKIDFLWHKVDFYPERLILQSRPWSDSIHDAIKESRLAWWDWQKSGSPSDPTPNQDMLQSNARRLQENGL